MTPLEAAIATGLPCFPCSASKTPAIPGPGGYKHATRDLAALRALWRRYPGPLVGVRTGETSGVSVLDIDGPKHPEADLWLAAHSAKLPATRVHSTRSGGQHLLFQHLSGVRNSQGGKGCLPKASIHAAKAVTRSSGRLPAARCCVTCRRRHGRNGCLKRWLPQHEARRAQGTRRQVLTHKCCSSWLVG
jgi:hypothetical protein